MSLWRKKHIHVLYNVVFSIIYCNWLLPTFPNKERNVLFWNEQSILRIGDCPMVLGMHQYVGILAEIDHPPESHTTAAQKSVLKWLEGKRADSIENISFASSGALDCLAC